MGYINNGKERSLQITVTKKLGGNVIQGYPRTYNGQESWGDPGYPTLTDTEVRRLTDSEFDARYQAFKAYVESIEAGVSFTTDIQGDGAIRDNAACTSTTTLPTTTVAPTTTTTTQQVFSPLLVGVSYAGVPFLLTDEGDHRQAAAYGSLSSAQYAHSVCVDYDKTRRQLFVGGNDGLLNIYDLSYPDGIVHKQIRIFSSGRISGLSVVNNYVLIGKERTTEQTGPIYVQPMFLSLDQYQNYQASNAGNTGTFGSFRNFTILGGKYYGVTNEGEIAEATSLSSWSETHDWDAHFTRIFLTTDKIIVLEDDDRPFYAMRATPNSWDDWDVYPGQEPFLFDGCALDNGEFLVIATDPDGIRRIGTDITNRDTDISPAGKNQFGGCCYNSSSKRAYFSAYDSNAGAFVLLTLNTLSFGTYAQVNAPGAFSRLFLYQ